MRLFEFADAESQMELWKLITDSVWQAIYKQAQEQKQIDAPKQAKPFKPKIVSPQPSKAKKTSAQAIQQQKFQSNAVKSKPKTTYVPSSSPTSVDAQKTLKTKTQKRVPPDSNSVADVQKQLDPLVFDRTLTKLTN